MDIQNIFQTLLKEIRKKNEVSLVSEKFSKIQSNSKRVSFARELLEEYKISQELIIDKKSDQTALDIREKGNEMFKRKKLQEAVDFYTQSLAHAPKGSNNYSKALANRSAALFELELYEECLNDIEVAIHNNYPRELQAKLLKRKQNALSQQSHEKRAYFKKIPEIPKKSASIQCASSFVEIINTQTEGRCVMARENIEIGHIVAIEKPFCHILVSGLYTHCHECLKLCYNLLPCYACTQTLYCTVQCQNDAIKYHKYECNILKTLRSLQLDKMKLLALKIATLVKHSYNLIAQGFPHEDIDVYKSDRYLEIHNLVANTDLRPVADLFERSTIAAVIFNLVKSNTNFFDNDKDESMFKELLLLHLQTAPSNFHEISELGATEDGYLESQEIGVGAFSFLSMFNHSCNPNVVRHCHGDVVVSRAIRSIKQGEQCYDNYGYHYALMSKAERKRNLKQQYFFECSCDVCEKDWPLLGYLSSSNLHTGVTDEDILDLRRGDESCADSICKKLLPKMGELEKLQPDRLFAEMQEVLKQCYALLGNVKRI